MLNAVSFDRILNTKLVNQTSAVIAQTPSFLEEKENKLLPAKKDVQYDVINTANAIKEANVNNLAQVNNTQIDDKQAKLHELEAKLKEAFEIFERAIDELREKQHQASYFYKEYLDEKDPVKKEFRLDDYRSAENGISEAKKRIQTINEEILQMLKAKLKQTLEIHKIALGKKREKHDQASYFYKEYLDEKDPVRKEFWLDAYRSAENDISEAKKRIRTIDEEILQIKKEIHELKNQVEKIIKNKKLIK